MEGKATDRQEPPGAATPSNQSGLSSWERLIQQVKKAVDAAPEVREDRVAAMQRALQNGTLNLSGKDIAEKLLAETRHDSERGV